MTFQLKYIPSLQFIYHIFIFEKGILMTPPNTAIKSENFSIFEFVICQASKSRNLLFSLFST